MKLKLGTLAEECISSHTNLPRTQKRYIFLMFTRTNIRLPDYFCGFFIALALDLMFLTEKNSFI